MIDYSDEAGWLSLFLLEYLPTYRHDYFIYSSCAVAIDECQEFAKTNVVRFLYNSDPCNKTGQFITTGPFSPPLVVKMPKRRNTSEHVTRMEIRMSTMIIQVIRDILLSEIKSESTSARSRNTRHRSLSTWIRGLISRYSRIARYSGWRVGSDSQMRFGTSRTFEAGGFC